MAIGLGQKVRDAVTGFEGIAISRVEYLNGCVQYCVKPRVGQENKMPDGEYIDSQQLEVVEAMDEVIARPVVEPTGGMMADVPRDVYSAG